MVNSKQVKEVVQQSAVYVPKDCEGIRIICTIEEESIFIGIGEESGLEYQVAFEEVDLKADLFYKLVLVGV